MKSKSRPSGEHDAVGVLYCHGWGSRFDPGKDKIRALAKMRPVDGITVDYTMHPRVVFEMYAARLMRHPRAIVVGTSLGGFYAAWLGAEFDRPFIAINPAIAPGTALRAYVGHGVNHVGERFELTQDCVTAYDALSFRLDGQGTIILDRGDEILDAQATLDFVRGRLPVVMFDGGSHRFDHMAELMESRPDLFHTR
jgi:uncharacterized protein